MKKKPEPKIATRKVGVDANETAAKPRLLDHNFAQSRDIHEDRGSVQAKFGRRANRGGASVKK